jgi:hypothetical protein
MSYGQRPVCELKAPTVVEGINDYQEQKSGEEAIIRALNQRFAHGLPSSTEGLLLPNDMDMARAIMRTWIVGSAPGVCLAEGVTLDLASKILDPAHSKYSIYAFCEEDGWYTATADSVEDLLAA